MKIFGLGFHKTGSTTLETALITLGYTAIGKQDHLFAATQNNNWEEVENVISQHDGFRDMPWPLIYKEIDKRYPGSKFILTVRDDDQWLQSCLNHYKDNGHKLFAEIYGEGNHFPAGKEDIWLKRYKDHNNSVREYFKNKPDQFLEVNWEKGDDWKKLCTFLNKPIPNREFPHANKGKYTFFEKLTRRIHYLVDKEGFKKKNRDL